MKEELQKAIDLMERAMYLIDKGRIADANGLIYTAQSNLIFIKNHQLN